MDATSREIVRLKFLARTFREEAQYKNRGDDYNRYMALARDYEAQAEFLNRRVATGKGSGHEPERRAEE